MKRKRKIRGSGPTARAILPSLKTALRLMADPALWRALPPMERKELERLLENVMEARK